MNLKTDIKRQIYSSYKPIGFSPLEALSLFSESNPEIKNLKKTYIGRLDPMAHGVQLNLINPTNESVSALKGLDKTYKVLIGLGIETDTYDLLGINTKFNPVKLNESEIKNSLLSFIGELNQPYPPFSAVRVKGQALHNWAKHNQLDQIQIPSHLVTIKSIKDIEIFEIELSQFFEFLFNHIPKIKGEFRQKIILKKWEQLLNKKNTSKYLQVIKCEIDCSSGTYIRQLTNELGSKLGVGAVAIEILRTHVGEYKLSDLLISKHLQSKPSFLLS